MTRWMKGFAVALALAGLPALAADDSAQAKDRAHEAQIHARMKARAHTRQKSVQGRADQAADATRAGGARSARAYHGAVRSTRKGVHRLGKKTENATK